MNKLKLSIELVPSTSWCTNLRSILSKKDWDLLRRESYKKANYRCEICSGVGKKHPVECHEIWKYNDKKKIQKLKGLISLCPSCHRVKHIGHSYIIGLGDLTKEHFKKINNLSEYEASIYIGNAFDIHKERSQYEWELDLSFLKEIPVKIFIKK